MRTHPLARRYAKTLFELALERDSLDQVVKEIQFFSALLDGNAKLRAYLFSPDVEKRKKMQAINELTANRYSLLMQNYLHLLVRKGRQGYYPEIAFEFGRLVDKERKHLRAIVTSALALSDQSINKLKEILSRSFGAEVILDRQVDPHILGGLVVNIDGKIMDASIRNQLQRLSKKLTSIKV